MGVYNNNKDGTRSTLANTIQVVDAPMEQFVSRGEFSAVTPNDVSADNKLVAENEVTKAVDTMPTASSSLVGTIVQYVGTTTANYTNGYFYKCVSDGAVTPTYSWVEVISGGGSGNPEFIGTMAEWNALTTEQKNQYDIVNILEDGQIFNISIPSGGTTSQILTKKSNADYDAEWSDGLESEVTILIPTNLFNVSETKYNFRPNTTASSTYNDGQTQNGVNTSNLIVCESRQKFKVSLTALPSYVRTFYYDANSVYVSSSSAITIDTDGYAMFEVLNNPNIAYVCLVANGNVDIWNGLIIDEYYHFTTVKKVIVNDLYFSDANVVMAKDRLGITGNVENILKDKKWAVIGDSFSEGDFTGVTPPTIPSGRYAGEIATYPYLIATRCGMEIQKLFKSGRTLANAADGTISDTVMSIYQNIAADADYLTIYIGINDSHHRASETGLIPIGTITDTVTTTFYGAYNTLLTWAITNRPNLHIGIIVSNGCETDEYRTATIAIAEKYGIPYIDMNGDKQTPCMIRSTNASIDSSIRAQRTSAWRVSETNGHPNADCHIFESTFIENFLRSL